MNAVKRYMRLILFPAALTLVVEFPIFSAQAAELAQANPGGVVPLEEAKKGHEDENSEVKKEKEAQAQHEKSYGAGSQAQDEKREEHNRAQNEKSRKSKEMMKKQNKERMGAGR